MYSYVAMGVRVSVVVGVSVCEGVGVGVGVGVGSCDGVGVISCMCSYECKFVSVLAQFMHCAFHELRVCRCWCSCG